MGCLYVVPTPIGNLEDITLRALRTLKEVSVVFAENTSHTRILFSHHDLRTPLRSYHQHNKRSRIPDVLEALAVGDVALVSDAGMPSISDPGFELIRAVVDAGMDVDVLPGPSAAMTAVVAAALPAPGFLFLGFPPRGTGDRRRLFEGLAASPWQIVLYESPHRLVQTLTDIRTELGDRPVMVGRELTKVHQEYARGSAGEIRDRFAGRPPRGECTVVVGAGTATPDPDLAAVAKELRHRRARGQGGREAVAEVARKYGVGRNAAYRLWLEAGREVEHRPAPGSDGSIE